MCEHWYFRIIFLSVGLQIYFSLRQIETQYNQVDTFTMITFFLGNMIGVKLQICLGNHMIFLVQFGINKHK